MSIEKNLILNRKCHNHCNKYEKMEIKLVHKKKINFYYVNIQYKMYNVVGCFALNISFQRI